MLSTEAKEVRAQTMKNMSSKYEVASRHKNVNSTDEQIITKVLGMPKFNGEGKYLGLPYLVAQSKKKISNPIAARLLSELAPR